MGDFIEEEEEDLYSDLPNFKYDETVDKLKADNKELQGRVVFLEDVLEKQSKELEGIRSQCETLTKNISSLLKTAQNEIKRKDNKINELNKMVLELKTEILTLKKRKNDCMTPINNEEPAFKQQKLENTSSVKSVSPQFFCNPEIIEKSNNQEESGESKINLPEKEYAPDIKCHTLYSKRMYNKIYNVGTQDCNRKSANIDTKNDDVFLENNVKANMNTKLEDKSMSRSKPKTQKERVSDKQLDHPTFNLQEKEAIVDSLKNSNNALRGMNAKELFNVIRNESSTLYNKNAGLEPTQLTNQDEKQIVLVPGSKSIQLNKEMSTHCSGTSPKREKSSSDYFNNETGKNNNCAQENVISRMNSSTSFSTTENFSKDVYIKHYTKNSKICTVVNKDKVYNVDNSKKIEKTDISSDKMQGHCNEKFAKSYCLKKSKKSIKSLICPISGEWAKNTEAVPPNNLVTMDVNKRNSPNGKTEKEDLDIMESLFGSPLKWTENSVDDGKQVEKLSPPATAFEDSCSAHIENLKFKETRNNVTEVSETKITELSLTKKFSYTERKCYFQPSGTEVDHKLPKFDSENKSEVSLSKDIHKQSIITHWPFKKTNNDIPTKNRSVTSPTFSSFVSTESTSEACDVPPSLKSNPNSLDLVNSSTKFLTSPKYNDSVLGQFDDTTQLISALAKDPSKLSPIHTPIKETKPDSTGAKTQYQLAENCSAKPLTIPIDDKNGSVTTDIEEKKIICKEPTSSVAENKTLPVSKASLTNRKTSKNPTVDKKPSVTKPLIPTFEKKLSIPASVISSVEKKLSFPFSVLSPVEKKIEKKTILLEQPINILCPRKTPRQISSCKQSVLSKKQNTVKDIIKNSQDELNFIKSPPFKQKQSKTEPQSTQELTTVGSNKNLEDDGRDLKNRDTVNIVSSNSEGDRKSKSPTNIFSKNKRAMSKNNFVSEDKTTISVRTLFKNDRSPVKDKIKHSHSRKENVPERREKKSPMKEKSPLKFKRDQRLVGRDSKIEIFKHPLHRRESFKRPNCHFRQSSVERKIAKDWRYSGKTRSLLVKAGNVSESSRTINCKVSKSNFNTKINDSKERHSLCYPNKTPVISRSSKISWSSSTGVVSTKPSKVQSYSEFSITPPTEMKWILRPIDFDVSSSNGLKESNIKSGSETSSITLVSNSKTEAETPVSKFFQATDSSIISPEKSSPGKSIVIVAERRPIKFGSNN